MEEDVTKTVIKTLRAYLSDELPLDQDFIRKLDHRDLLASDKAAMLVALADKGDRSCIHQLITYMEQFYTEEMLLRLCDFLEEYAHQARPRLATIASRIRQEISKHKPKITPPVPEDTLHRSAGAHDEPPEMDTEGGDGDAPSRPPGAGTKRGHQTAKEDAPIAKNLKPTDSEAVVEPPEMNTGSSNVPSQPLGAGTKRGHQTAKADTPIAKNPKPAKVVGITTVYRRLLEVAQQVSVSRSVRAGLITGASTVASSLLVGPAVGGAAVAYASGSSYRPALQVLTSMTDAEKEKLRDAVLRAARAKGILLLTAATWERLPLVDLKEYLREGLKFAGY